MSEEEQPKISKQEINKRLDGLFDEAESRSQEEPQPEDEHAGLFTMGDSQPEIAEETVLEDGEDVAELSAEDVVHDTQLESHEQPYDDPNGGHTMTEPQYEQPDTNQEPQGGLSRSTIIGGALATILTGAAAGVIGGSIMASKGGVSQKDYDATKQTVGEHDNTLKGVQSTVDKNRQDTAANAGKINTLEDSVKNAAGKAQDAQDAAAQANDAAQQAKDAATAAQKRADDAYDKAAEASEKATAPEPVPAGEDQHTYRMHLTAENPARRAKAMALANALYQWDKKRGRADRWNDRALTMQYVLEDKVNTDGNSILSAQEVKDAIAHYTPILKKHGIEITVDAIGTETTFELSRLVKFYDDEDKEHLHGARADIEAADRRAMSNAEFVYRFVAPLLNSEGYAQRDKVERLETAAQNYRNKKEGRK